MFSLLQLECVKIGTCATTGRRRCTAPRQPVMKSIFVSRAWRRLVCYYTGINANTQESGSAGSSLLGGKWHRWGVGVFAADHDAVMPHTMATALPRGGYLRAFEGQTLVVAIRTMQVTPR